MNGIDLSAWLPIIAKSGVATVVLAGLFGLSHVITAWRGGSVSERKEADMQQRLTDVEARLAAAEGRISKLQGCLHDMRFQRDQARLRVEFLELKHGEEPRTTWPSETEDA